MSQDSIGKHCVEQLPLLLYGELSFDEEEQMESHLAVCRDCRVAWEQQQELTAVLDSVAVEPSPTLLRQARSDLFARLEQEPAVRTGWWDRLIDFATPQLPSALLRPATAMVLVAMGFTGARMAPGLLPNFSFLGSGSGGAGSENAGVSELSLADIGPAARVRYVERIPDGRVQIVLDETHQRTVLGPMEDENIRGLLLEATRDPSDPGLRAESMELLASRLQGTDPGAARITDEVKAALIYAIHDSNDGVRLKAIEGLKNFAADADVRAALSEVLLADKNPAMRNQAIDLLMQGMEDTNVQSAGTRPDAGERLSPGDTHMVNLLQQLIKREEKNPYVRQRSRRALELVNAVQETY